MSHAQRLTNRVVGAWTICADECDNVKQALRVEDREKITKQLMDVQKREEWARFNLRKCEAKMAADNERCVHDIAWRDVA